MPQIEGIIMYYGGGGGGGGFFEDTNAFGGIYVPCIILLARQVKVTVGVSSLSCCVHCVIYVERSYFYILF